MSTHIVETDITTMAVDAIVNAANSRLRMGGGVCGAIFDAAGPAELTAACKPLAPIETGQAVITPGFKLPARFVIHTVGPIYHGGTNGEEDLLRSCYRNSLELAVKNGCHSIAFPIISSGIFGYPPKAAFAVAKDEVDRFFEFHQDMEIYLAVLDKSVFM